MDLNKLRTTHIGELMSCGFITDFLGKPNVEFNHIRETKRG
jgi:hypothetical protein